MSRPKIIQIFTTPGLDCGVVLGLGEDGKMYMGSPEGKWDEGSWRKLKGPRVAAILKRVAREYAAQQRRKADRDKNREWLSRLSDAEYRSAYQFQHRLQMDSGWVRDNFPDLPVDEVLGGEFAGA